MKCNARNCTPLSCNYAIARSKRPSSHNKRILYIRPHHAGVIVVQILEENHSTNESILHTNKCFSGVCNGTLGELLQAPVLYEDKVEIAILSLPIQRFSWVYFMQDAEANCDTSMGFRSKCKYAMELYLQRNNLELPEGRWVFSSELVCGRGMASSTADIVATLRCMDTIFNRQSSYSEIADILRNIERSDSIYMDTYALYLSSRQKPIHILPNNSGFHVYYIDEGNKVDTEGVTETLLSHYHSNLAEYTKYVSQMVSAFEHSDLFEIAKCATHSSILGHHAIPKKTMDVVLENQHRLKANGIVVAHTGSLIGYLFVKQPCPKHAGEISAFFRQVGFQCRYERAQF